MNSTFEASNKKTSMNSTFETSNKKTSMNNTFEASNKKTSMNNTFEVSNKKTSMNNTFEASNEKTSVNNTFEVSIVRAGQYPLKFSAISLTLPVNNGFIGVMANRKPMLATLDAGVVALHLNSDKTLYFGVTGGFAEVVNNKASLLCDWLLNAEELQYDNNLAQKPFYFKNTKNMTENQKREYITHQMHRKRYLIKDTK